MVLLLKLKVALNWKIIGLGESHVISPSTSSNIWSFWKWSNVSLWAIFLFRFVSPSMLLVSINDSPWGELDVRITKSQGKYSSSLTFIISPTIIRRHYIVSHFWSRYRSTSLEFSSLSCLRRFESSTASLIAEIASTTSNGRRMLGTPPETEI